MLSRYLDSSITSKLKTKHQMAQLSSEYRDYELVSCFTLLIFAKSSFFFFLWWPRIVLLQVLNIFKLRLETEKSCVLWGISPLSFMAIMKMRKMLFLGHWPSWQSHFKEERRCQKGPGLWGTPALLHSPRSHVNYNNFTYVLIWTQLIPVTHLAAQIKPQTSLLLFWAGRHPSPPQSAAAFIWP